MSPSDVDSDVEMRNTETAELDLVLAAQDGDQRALSELVRINLPLVYTIVRRALSGHPDADDVVQDTMLRAIRGLPDLRSPDSFRAWLAGIAVRQVGTHLHRRDAAAARTTPLDDLIEWPDFSADVENLTTLQTDLSRQRRQVVRASRWLDPDDRTLLSLWWLEVAGQLTRAELAQALRLSIPHAGVRIQRMRTQLDVSRSVVAALDVRRRCAQLASAISGWNGRPCPLWRKRIARHIRSCPHCSHRADDLVVAERLLVGFVLLPVPMALTAGLISKISLGLVAASTPVAIGSAGAAVGVTKIGLISQIMQNVMSHPVAATIAAGTLAAGAAVTAVTLSEPPPPPPTVITAPTSAPVALIPIQTRPPAPRPSVSRTPASRPSPTRTSVASSRQLAAGPVSLEAANRAGMFVSTTDTVGFLAAATSVGDPRVRQRATFDVVAGLADPSCFSFRLPDGMYLRHSSWRLRAFIKESTDQLFEVDATFCVRPGSVPGSISLSSYNYPSYFLHIRGEELWVDPLQDTPEFRADASFLVRLPLTG